MKNLLSKLVVLVFLLSVGCHDDDGIKFEGIVAKDALNQALGTIGSRDLEDWGNDGSLSKKVLDLLATTPDQDITGTNSADITLSVYPNPTANSFIFKSNLTGGPSVLECIIVNEKMKVLRSGSVVGPNPAFYFDVSNREKFPSGSIVRVYYSFSAEGDQNFYVGHGDVLICDPASQDCF